MGLITQLETVETGRAILANATRAASQFNNSATSLLAELAQWEASLPAAGLDQETLDEITAIKAQVITSIQSQISDLQAALSNA